MNIMRKLLVVIGLLTSVSVQPAWTQTLVRQPAYVWFYDGRDDDRDFPTNGVFPGDFAPNPAGAAFSARGFFGDTSHRAPVYVSQAAEQQRLNYCAQRYHSYDPASGTYVGRDHLRHRC